MIAPMPATQPAVRPGVDGPSDGSQEGPHVVILGGFLTEPWVYGPMRDRLLRRGAVRVTIAPMHLPDWALMALVGMGPLLLRGARAIREGRREAPAPVVVIGHSMGGIVARLAMSPEPLDGRHAGVAADVGCLVTLGTPHRFVPVIPWRHPGVRATEHLDRSSPGGWWEPETGYLTVGAIRVPYRGRARTRTLAHGLNSVLRLFVGETPDQPGDGLIGDDLCRLEGVRHLALPDALHGTFYGPWYGDEAILDQWWPFALETWRSALTAREDAHRQNAGSHAATLDANPDAEDREAA